MVPVGARAHPGDGHSGKEAYTPEGRALCPVMAAISIVGTEWRLAIAHRLLDGPQRFSELLRSNPRLNAKTLSATLKYLENAGVVQRNVVSTRPFSVVYSLTEMGLGLAPAVRGPTPLRRTPLRGGCFSPPLSAPQIARTRMASLQPPRRSRPTSPRGDGTASLACGRDLHPN